MTKAFKLTIIEVLLNERARKMVDKLKRLYKSWQAERRRQKWLNEKLEGLTDYGFLDRATADER